MSDQPEPTMVELFQYNHWANQELMAICMGLSDENDGSQQPRLVRIDSGNICAYF